MTRKTHIRSLALPAIALLAIASLGAGLGGCASVPLTPDDCARVDWADKGYRAGFNGRAPVAPSAKSDCLTLGFAPDLPAFDAGWAEGNANFCTPRRVLEVGLKRDVDLGVCTGPGERVDGQLVDMASFAAGHRRVKADHDRAESRLSTARSDIRRHARKIDKHEARIVGWQAELETAPEAARPEIRHAIEKYRNKIAERRRKLRRARSAREQARYDLDAVAPAYRRSVAEVNGALRALGG